MLREPRFLLALSGSRIREYFDFAISLFVLVWGHHGRQVTVETYSRSTVFLQSTVHSVSILWLWAIFQRWIYQGRGNVLDVKGLHNLSHMSR